MGPLSHSGVNYFCICTFQLSVTYTHVHMRCQSAIHMFISSVNHLSAHMSFSCVNHLYTRPFHLSIIYLYNVHFNFQPPIHFISAVSNLCNVDFSYQSQIHIHVSCQSLSISFQQSPTYTLISAVTHKYTFHFNFQSLYTWSLQLSITYRHSFQLSITYVENYKTRPYRVVIVVTNCNKISLKKAQNTLKRQGNNG